MTEKVLRSHIRTITLASFGAGAMLALLLAELKGKMPDTWLMAGAGISYAISSWFLWFCAGRRAKKLCAEAPRA